ncbi:hypothetical protein B1H10_00655, partial [candidate division KSB1 bacterium 4484_188]
MAELKKLPDDIAQSCYKRELTQSVNFYLQGVKARGFIPKTDLQSRLILDDRDKYLITRMGYTHLRPSDEA